MHGANGKTQRDAVAATSPLQAAPALCALSHRDASELTLVTPGLDVNYYSNVFKHMLITLAV